MVNSCICGSGSFQRQLEEDDLVHAGSPRKPKKGSKNPFADRGLEKFSALLAELEDKKKQIYTQLGSEEIAFIRFDYSKSNCCKPIVVKVKEREKDHRQQQDKDDTPAEINNSAAVQVQESRTDQPGNKKVNDQKGHRSWDFLKREMWRKPSYYLPAVMIMILLFVVLFGRSFAILCTSIGWYMIPAVTGGESNLKRVKKKKDYGRRASDKGMVVRGGKKDYVRRASDKGMVVGEAAARTSPTSVISGAMTEFLPEERIHWKSF
ncbi:hypothetical protein RHSIM_Rhsim07G0219700 [Rhododendron simsii]|uniref:ZCF37 n=1 Tax=Rhododendron simsii TaxID=118357 RepID=A0A834H0S4_RHOSS|nr:hypothetical protein RHSIM_Rhsim07G0219700 [Rhododendron simsii]